MRFYVFALMFLMVGIVGCKGIQKTDPVAQPPLVTVFPPSAPIPSVTPAATQAASEASSTLITATQIQNVLSKLTAENLAIELPKVLDKFQTFLQSLVKVSSLTEQTKNQAENNDTAVKLKEKEVSDLKKIINDKDALINKTNGDNLIAIGKKNDEIKAIKEQLNGANEKMVRLFWLGTMVLGGLFFLGGAAVAFFVSSARGLGIVASGLGVLLVALGTAGMMYGKIIAIAGLSVAGVIVLASIGFGIYYIKQHYTGVIAKVTNGGVEIATGLQNAIIAGAVEYEKVKPFLDQAQGSTAKAIVDLANKDVTKEEVVKAASTIKA